MNELDLRGWEDRLPVRAGVGFGHPGEEGCHKARIIESGRAADDPVEILWKAQSLHRGHATTGGAPDKVRFLLLATVVRLEGDLSHAGRLGDGSLTPIHLGHRVVRRPSAIQDTRSPMA